MNRALLLLVLALTLTACGGGGGGDGSGDDGGAGVNVGAIGGAVSGTTVMAVNSNGNIITTDDTAGRQEDVDTDNDGRGDAFSFQLKGIPLNDEIRIFLVSGGLVYPVYFDTDGDGTSDTNVLSLTAAITIDLGFVDTGIVGEEGRAVSENDPTDTADIAIGPENPSIPLGINTPPTTGLSLSQLIDKGSDAMADGWVLGARTYFEAAVDVAGESTSNDADTARFLFALTRFLALGFDTQSDGKAANMDRIGDILDRLGVADDEVRANWELINTPNPLPANSPTGNEYRDFLYEIVSTELIGSVTNLDTISPSFNTTWTNWQDGKTFESDYGDVLFLRGTFKTILATIAIQRAYELDGDVDDIYNNNHDVDAWNDITVESFLNTNDFLSLTDATKLVEAKGYLTASALDDYEDAIDEISAETDLQGDDLVTLDDFSDPAYFKTVIGQARDSILGVGTTVGDSQLDLQRFFDIGVDFRSPSSLLPPFAGNNASGLFPDATFDGVVLTPDLNEDINPVDGIPDILQ